MDTARRAFARPLILLVAAALGAALLPSSAQAGLPQDGLVSSTPVAYTPQLKAGHIHENAVVGDTVYAVGKFRQFENTDRTVTYNRRNFVAYSATTGEVLPLVINFDDEITSIVASPDGQFLYIGGFFSTVRGQALGSLVRVSVATGRVSKDFHGPGGRIYSLAYANGKLYAAGSFAGHLLALDPSTGADTGTVAVDVGGVLEVSGGLTRVSRVGINPAGTELVALGDFTTVDGQSRNSAFRLAIGTDAATLIDWHPERFDVSCSAKVPYYLRNVDWAPDGSYFVIVSSGGPAGGYPATGMCDAAGRWEATSSGTVAEPTWINWTGGDSLYSVAISSTAVYVGGHQRWLDNVDGHDSEGSNAYEVDSVGVITPATGLADRSWNARYMTRAHGKEDLTLFDGGLLVGGDGTIIKGKYHAGTAIFPLS